MLTNCLFRSKSSSKLKKLLSTSPSRRKSLAKKTILPVKSNLFLSLIFFCIIKSNLFSSTSKKSNIIFEFNLSILKLPFALNLPFPFKIALRLFKLKFGDFSNLICPSLILITSKFLLIFLNLSK